MSGSLFVEQGASVALKTHHGTKTVQEFAYLYQQHSLNFSPGFQRQSVWTESDRRLLINSLFDGIPIPSVYLYRQAGNGGKLRYDVIDGKQRLESILLYMNKGPLVGLRDDVLRVKRAFNDDDPLEWWSWQELNASIKHDLLATEIPTIEVDGELGEIIELFVRINATGKHLTAQEKLHAKYYTSPVLRTAQKLADEFESLLKSNRVLSTAQIQRMKHVELLTELLLSIDVGEPLHKKTKLNDVIKGGALSHGDLAVASTNLKRAINLTFTILPDLKTTRFRQLADFYSLVLLLHELRAEGLAVSTHGSHRNALAGSLLRNFGLDVDRVSENVAKGKGITELERPFLEYLTTVKEGTDSKTQRKQRDRILRDVLSGVFEPLDSIRGFNTTQRRILWHSSNKICAVGGEQIERWEDVDIDHVTSFIKGGKTKLENAALTCAHHNRAKGAD